MLILAWSDSVFKALITRAASIADTKPAVPDPILSLFLNI